MLEGKADGESGREEKWRGEVKKRRRERSGEEDKKTRTRDYHAKTHCGLGKGAKAVHDDTPRSLRDQ